jgi:NAD(P)-dependent dehydrogenase (short-subunit alcohol dehydrogenase family)
MSKSATIIIGASGGLGSALSKHWRKSTETDYVIAISRQAFPCDESSDDKTIQFIQCDYSETSIIKTCEEIKTLMENLNLDSINRVCICNGILHNEETWPEKRIEDISINSMQQVFYINSVIPMLWLKALISLVKGRSDCVISVFSARIGSIGDNHSGGWYSYRASKAALNMLLKTAAIEYARRAKNVKIIAFHPGTTDTFLSKPFQMSVKPENLFTTDFVARHLVDIMNKQTIDGQLSFIDWENNDIVW